MEQATIAPIRGVRPVAAGEYLSLEDIAQTLKVSIHTVRAWRKRNILPPAIKIGKLVRYNKSAMDSWFRAHTEKRVEYNRQVLQKRRSE